MTTEICNICDNIQPIGAYTRPFCPYCVGKWYRNNKYKWNIVARIGFRLMPKAMRSILDLYLGLSTSIIPVDLENKDVRRYIEQ